MENSRVDSRERRSRPVVLVVEDEPGDAALIRFQLLERDDQAFDVHLADSLGMAERMLETGACEPDVVLLDLNLPDSTGTRTVERCRELTEAPIVVLTGLDDVAATQMAIESGAEDYLSKGGEASGLRRAIRYALLRHRRDTDARLAATVFTHAREGVIITDAKGCIVDVNKTFTRITGYERDEVLGRSPSFLKSGRHGETFYREFWKALVSQGHWYGEIWNRRKNGEVFVEMLTVSAVVDRRGKIRHFVGLFSDISVQKEYERRLKKIAHYDALTGLPNRVLLSDRLGQAMERVRRNGQRLALAYIDLDGFKYINDRHGHDAGDRLLVGLAVHMTECLRECDTVARLGGDEFVALLTDLSPVNDHTATSLITRLMAAIRQTVHVNDVPLHVSGSVGVSFYPQNDDIDADQLLRQADQAMYQAKLAGRNRFHVFDVEHDASVRGYHQQLEHIAEALRRREFVLHYQPKVNMRTGTVVGVEALIRWQHPERGLLSPANFLPQVEQHPLEIEIGRWVIDTALKQIEAWRAQGLEMPVSVNVTAYHLQQPDFVEDVDRALAAHPGVRGEWVELEVLESSALDDIGHVSAIIDACAARGIRVSLDDFGTGYSSLTYLKRLPADILKIDQSFVRDMLHDADDLAILEGVLGLAKAFRRTAVAEGVETEEHGRMLLQLGCELAQGYGIARPMPENELPSWVASWKPKPGWAMVPLASPAMLPLLYAAAEHRGWMQGIEAYISGAHQEMVELDPARCRFGQWLEGGGLPDEFNARRVEVDATHRRVHRAASALYARTQAQAGTVGAEDWSAELESLRVESKCLIDMLDALVESGTLSRQPSIVGPSRGTTP